MGCPRREGILMAKTTPAKVHIHGASLNVMSDSRGTVVEAFCARCKLQSVVVPLEVYRKWTGDGYINEIFCGDCVREIVLQSD